MLLPFLFAVKEVRKELRRQLVRACQLRDFQTVILLLDFHKFREQNNTVFRDIVAAPRCGVLRA